MRRVQDPHGVSELIRAAKPSVEEGEALKAMRIKVQAAAWQLLDHACRLPPVGRAPWGALGLRAVGWSWRGALFH